LFSFPKFVRAHLRASALPKIFTGLYLRILVKGEGKGSERKDGEELWGEMDIGRGDRNKGGKAKEKERKGRMKWEG
jgi:hypothetical protein